MTGAQVEAKLEKALAGLPGCRGMNNHMGSAATEDPALMAGVCRFLRDRGLFFIDSKTSPRSVGESQAKKAGLPSAHRDVFLDNSEDPGSILIQLDRAVVLARKRGTAVAIGHFRLPSLRVLEEAVPKLRDKGVHFVLASEVVR